MTGLSECASNTTNQQKNQVYNSYTTAEQTAEPRLLKIMWSLYVIQEIGFIKRAVSSSWMWLLHFWLFICGCYSLWKLAETDEALEMGILSVLFLSPLSGGENAKQKERPWCALHMKFLMESAICLGILILSHTVTPQF